MGSTSPFRGFVLPTIAGDQGQWGTELNTTISDLDSILGSQTTFQSSTYGTNITPSSSQSQVSRMTCVSTGVGPFTLNLKSSNYALGLYNISNQTQGNLTVTTGLGTTQTVTSQSGTFLFSDGTNVSQTIFAPAPVSQLAYMGFITGLTLSTAGGSSVFGITKGQAADSTVVDLMTLPSNFTKAGASLWTVGSGGGSLDAGTMTAGKWYHVFLIKRPDTGVVDILTSLSVNAPALPTNYTLFRRIGSMKAIAGPIWQSFMQVDDEFYWGPPVNDLSGFNLTTTLTGIAVSAPAGIQTKITFTAAWLSGVGNVAYLWGGFTGGDLSSVLASYLLNCVTTATYQSGQFTLWTDASTPAPLIFAKSNVNNAANALYITTHGYKDRRGKDGSA